MEYVVNQKVRIRRLKDLMCQYNLHHMRGYAFSTSGNISAFERDFIVAKKEISSEIIKRQQEMSGIITRIYNDKSRNTLDYWVKFDTSIWSYSDDYFEKSEVR